jgi:putative ABC transport system permease protein
MDTIDHARLTTGKRSRTRDLFLVGKLALADYLHERRLSFPLIISLAAVLTPLLVLFGLKFGIISTMDRALTEDPRSRELRPLGQERFGSAWFKELRGRPEAAFVLEKTRFLAATIDLRHSNVPDASPAHAELTPSAKGDPLLAGLDVRPDGFKSIILSAPAAETLRVEVGEQIEGRIGRTLPNGKREVIRFDLRVAAILPPAKSGRVEALVSLTFMLAAEDFREGYAVPQWNTDGRPRPQGERYFASFRLYARDIYDVATLRQWLADRGVRSDTRLGEIELLKRLDHSLTILYAIVAGLGGVGYLISLTVSLWANTERKRRELSVLRLIGLRSTALAFIPCMQALFTAVVGSSMAIGLYMVSEIIINHLFQESLAEQQVLSNLEIVHFAVAAGITVIFAVIASLVAGFRAASVSPSEGLRDE